MGRATGFGSGSLTGSCASAFAGGISPGETSTMGRTTALGSASLTGSCASVFAEAMSPGETSTMGRTTALGNASLTGSVLLVSAAEISCDTSTMGRDTAFERWTCSVLTRVVSGVKERGSLFVALVPPVEGSSITSGANCGRLLSLIWRLLTKLPVCYLRLFLVLSSLASGTPRQP